jgi:outer membrane protein OmpA-like peptidoglycan-associated protein
MFTWRKSQLLGVGILAVAVAATAAYSNFADANKPREITVQFERGTQLENGAKESVMEAAGYMFANDAYTAKVIGHTGTVGSSDANVQLSQRRAEAVKKLLVDNKVAPDRIDTLGVGGGQPLAREEGESTRAYQSRLSRATVILRRQ